MLPHTITWQKGALAYSANAPTIFILCVFAPWRFDFPSVSLIEKVQAMRAEATYHGFSKLQRPRSVIKVKHFHRRV